MPSLISPALPPGHLHGLRQPQLPLPGNAVLRPWRLTDAPTVRAAFDCPEIQRWHTLRMDSDLEAEDWIAEWERHWYAEKNASWAIVVDDTPAGQVGLRRISLFEADAAVSYWMLPAARGKGIAAQAVQAMTTWAFDTLGLNRLSLTHSTVNGASCRVATKASFGLEGTMRRCMRHADGWHDMHLHARLRP